MNAKDFKRVFNEAKNDNIDWELEYYKIGILTGCGLPDFEPVSVTLRTAAAHVRYQGMQMNGEWHEEAVNDCKDIFRSKVSLLD